MSAGQTAPRTPLAPGEAELNRLEGLLVGDGYRMEPEIARIRRILRAPSGGLGGAPITTVGTVEAKRYVFALTDAALAHERAVSGSDEESECLAKFHALLDNAIALVASYGPLRKALADLLAEHVDHVRASSQGRVNPEEKPVVIAARAALSPQKEGPHA